MSDYISREKYLQDVEHYKNQICYMSNVSMDDCIKICNEQPSADVRENRWIPISERLPEEEQEVLCQLSDDSCAVLYVQDNWGQMDWVDGQMGTGAYDVIAWQPLPKPYQKGSEE